MLRIPVDKICVVIALAREALGSEAEESALLPDPLADGQPLPSGEDYDEAAFDALFEYVDALNGDELADLLSLTRLGAGEISIDEWPQAVTEAEDAVGDGDVVAELIQNPTLADDLISGLEGLGYACTDE